MVKLVSKIWIYFYALHICCKTQKMVFLENLSEIERFNSENFLISDFNSKYILMIYTDKTYTNYLEIFFLPSAKESEAGTVLFEVTFCWSKWF